MSITVPNDMKYSKLYLEDYVGETSSTDNVAFLIHIHTNKE